MTGPQLIQCEFIFFPHGHLNQLRSFLLTSTGIILLTMSLVEYCHLTERLGSFQLKENMMFILQAIFLL